MKTLAAWLAEAEARLAEAGIESARAEARLLAVHALGRSRAWILAHGDDPVDTGQVDPWLARRVERVPLAHLTGTREFYGRPFRVTADTLIPRPETELLIDLALQHAPKGGRVLDVGTGTGCIGISVALERPDLEVTLLDLSPAALAVARENAKTLGAEVRSVESDLYSGLPKGTDLFHLIDSNPPYIPQGEPLMPEVVRYEPALALFGGEDGLSIYRRLARESSTWLGEGGALVVEIGYDQSETVPRIFEEAGWQEVQRLHDLQGHVRSLLFRRTEG